MSGSNPREKGDGGAKCSTTAQRPHECGADCSTSGREVDRTIRIEAPEGYSREAIDDFAIVVQEVADALAPDGGAVVSGQYEPPTYEIRVTTSIEDKADPTLKEDR